MIVACGNFRHEYCSAASTEAALASANDGTGVAWIGTVDPSADELGGLGRALGMTDEVLTQIAERRAGAELSEQGREPQPARVGASVFDGVAHLILANPTMTPSGLPSWDGEVEVLATPAAVVVATRGLGTARQPPAILAGVAKAFKGTQRLTGGSVVGQVISLVFDWYLTVLNEIERELAEIADELFGDRRSEALARIYGVARPVHHATVAVHPIAHSLDRVLRELGEDIDSDVARGRRAEAAYLSARIDRLNDFLVSTLQIYLGLAQDAGNALADKRNANTQKMSAVALLLAIPTIIFSIYGTNFKDIPLLKENWAYPFILAVTAALCGYTYWRLRRADWL